MNRARHGVMNMGAMYGDLSGDALTVPQPTQQKSTSRS